MKFIAYILLFSMGILGLAMFTGDMDLTELRFEMSCDEDCCEPVTQEVQDIQDSQDGQEDNEDKDQCPPDCDCSYDFHMVAIEYHYMTSFVIAPKAIQYGNYTNTYHFEYLNPLFQPPRFS